MQLTVEKIRSYLTDVESAQKICRENYNALLAIRDIVPDRLSDSYSDLVCRGAVEMEILNRIEIVKRHYNPFCIMDVGAGIAVAQWLFDVFIFSRRMNGVLP
jgi:hypothetical protein